jgi:MinD-like ATPase involved in chromosome partitioning or flagellar assembly
VLETVERGAAASPGELASYADPRAALPDQPPPEAPVTAPDVGIGTGRVLAVWGPTGAPGRTTVALGLASEIAARGRSTLLVDGDVYGGVLAQLLGVLDEAPGLAAAARLANNGQLHLAALAQLARAITPSLRLLSGISRADRWPELRPAALESVLGLTRSLAAVTVVDCAFCLEQDEELAFDTSAPRRNGATLTFLESADVVVAVGSADPVGLQRLVRGLGELKEAVPGLASVVVINRFRLSGVPGDAEREIRGALQRYAGIDAIHLVPFDVGSVDGAVAAGRTLTEAAASSPMRLALADLAAGLLGVQKPVRRRRLGGLARAR